MPLVPQLHPDVTAAFAAHPELYNLCGRPIEADAQSGLTNRVFRVGAERGVFFLRLPCPEAAGVIDRVAEAHNLNLASANELALPPIYCDVASGILVTRAVTVLEPPPADLPEQLGAALARLHTSGTRFQGHIDPQAIFRAQAARLPLSSTLSAEWRELCRTIEALAEAKRPDTLLVPSHGDPSPGNCLPVAGGVWLIDWEYSAMAVPAWDLAYALVEHDFGEVEEGSFLKSYCMAGAADLCPASAQLALMKARCDAVSALWAFEQVAAGRDRSVFLPFARARRDRALRRLQDFAGRSVDLWHL
ncbi:phosphotransferase [Roseibium sediminicola]|uniref:Phosphotransferase n=1 Tax=Roseibium sediminicola TaxID=2933272 RepID=A0ABT0GUU2_9HYPH|nr:phosphotransferase [Roseibium sp. CAU 1639]MCK7612640.1 phosphotransferase [Roseibium sp. CAU 1639]